MKSQTTSDLQQDYLDAMEVAAKYMAADSARAAELFSTWAAELGQKSGPEFAELRVIALLNLCRMLERLQQTNETTRTRQAAISLLDQISEPGSRLNIQDRLALTTLGPLDRRNLPSELR